MIVVAHVVRGTPRTGINTGTLCFHVESSERIHINDATIDPIRPFGETRCRNFISILNKDCWRTAGAQLNRLQPPVKGADKTISSNAASCGTFASRAAGPIVLKKIPGDKSRREVCVKMFSTDRSMLTRSKSWRSRSYPQLGFSDTNRCCNKLCGAFSYCQAGKHACR